MYLTCFRQNENAMDILEKKQKHHTPMQSFQVVKPSHE